MGMCYSLRPRLFSDPIAASVSNPSPDSELPPPPPAAAAPHRVDTELRRGDTAGTLRSSGWQQQQNGGDRERLQLPPPHSSKKPPEKQNKNWDKLRAEEKEAEREAKKVSKYIDKILKEQKREYKQTHRLLLLEYQLYNLSIAAFSHFSDSSVLILPAIFSNTFHLLILCKSILPDVSP
ncbi:hypothetical protein scyTo_0002417 [Scyliorhinus torazame]|uniref:Uncharacterized protein n=1 Tax=Scyliorhinus torazame TaxID=75743 RepID=A0A401PJE8_SCYTO|nr:hypothetical protein [Scyliorhinus torazame]